MELIVQSGMASCYGVLTNGKLLPKMGDGFWRKLGEHKMELRMSCYPDLPEHIVPLAMDKAKEHGFSVRPQAISVFKPLFMKNDGSTYYGCPWNRCLTIHEGFFYLCPLTAFFPKQFMDLPETIDGIPLDGLTEEALGLFFKKDTPLETCKICAGAKGVDIPWYQPKSKKEWMETAGMELANG